jgi:hypothetical protein
MLNIKKLFVIFFISLNFGCVISSHAQLDMGTVNSIFNLSNAIQAEKEAKEAKEREEKITIALIVILLVVAIIYIRSHLKCPDCRGLVLKDARKCKHCGCSLTPQ